MSDSPTIRCTNKRFTRLCTRDPVSIYNNHQWSCTVAVRRREQTKADREGITKRQGGGGRYTRGHPYIEQGVLPLISPSGAVLLFLQSDPSLFGAWRKECTDLTPRGLWGWIWTTPVHVRRYSSATPIVPLLLSLSDATVGTRYEECITSLSSSHSAMVL